MKRRAKGFSLVELLVAVTLSLVLGTMMFLLFHQNERVVRDETLVTEMQQTARIVASQIADEIRMAGQGVPLYAAGFDAAASEAVAVFLNSSGANRIDFRGGFSDIETAGSGSSPIDFNPGVSRSFLVAATSGFSTGEFVYIFGPSISPTWTWLRGEVTSVGLTALTVTPRQTGTIQPTIHFSAPPTIALEEAVSIYLSDGSVRRATASPKSDPAQPDWSAANEIGRHFKALVFTYSDSSGNIVEPTSLTNRLAISRVDVQLTVEVAQPLSDGSRPNYSLALRIIPRNIPARWAQL